MVEIKRLNVGGETYEIVDEAARADIDKLESDIKSLQTKDKEILESMDNIADTFINRTANAITKTISGEVVQADDVSPIEHEMSVNVYSKNFFNISKIGTTQKFTKNADNSITVLGGQYSCPSGLQLKTLCPFLKVGETAVLSIDTDGLDFIYSNGILKHGVPFVVTEKILEGYVAIYGVDESDNDFGNEHTIRHIQIEYGETSTEYTPYVDPTTVKVTVADKTYIPKIDGSVEGILSTALEDGISTDTEGVTIECEYIQDTNKVIERLTNAIVALGGTV
jgi:hypothetical protein